MKYYIIIPAHNEADLIGLTLDSIAAQTILPKQVIVVNDHSTDNTADVVSNYLNKQPFLSLVNHISHSKHLPGSKVIQAFNKGLTALDEQYDFIVKLDADVILPNNYFEELINVFTNNPKAGIVGGLCYIQHNNKWVYENIADKNHVRGPIKSYRKACFKDIGGLRKSIGWDTVDTLLAKYHNWETITLKQLQVKHLKPTGKNYNRDAQYKQGEALYKMRYGILLTLITAFKIAFLKQKPILIFHYLKGYCIAKQHQAVCIVNAEEGAFIRKIRWQGIKTKLGLKN